jgi:predicted RNase H-like HicB family nuclease
MALEYTVYCDQCGSIMAASGKSGAEARAEAKQAWGAVRRGRRDYCGQCLQLEKAHA